MITMTFRIGKIGFVDTGFSQKATRTPQLEVYGTEGTLSFTKPYMENKLPELYIDCPERGLRGWITPDSWEVVPERLISQCCCLKDIIRAIEGDHDPVLTPEHARHILEIMCKIPEAIDSGSTVEIETTF